MATCPPGASLPGGFAPHTDRQTLTRAATASRWLVIAIVVLAAGPIVGLPAISAPAALLIAGLGLAAGVPHGAIDHLTAARLTGGTSVVLVSGAYAALAVAAWAVMAWVGPVALMAVVGLSALHFGLGELEVSRQLTGWRPAPAIAAAIVVAGCGALLLPLARSGEQLAEVASAVSPEIAQLIGSSRVQTSLVVVWLVAAMAAVAGALWSGHRAVALDIVLVGLLGTLAPPLVAFAVWFGGWHALRHYGRILTTEPGCAALVAACRGRAAVRRFIGLAAWPSMAALAVVAALGWITAVAPDPAALMAEALRVLLALTVPHMVVVLWLDRSPLSDT